MFYIYIIKSKKDETFYIGFTKDFVQRLDEHNFGSHKYTSNKRPWELVYTEGYETKSQAVSRERYLKKLKSRVYLEKLIEKKNGLGS